MPTPFRGSRLSRTDPDAEQRLMLTDSSNLVAGLALIVLVVLSALFCVQLTAGVPVEALDSFLSRWMSPLAPTSWR